jgi:RNA polymerase sigma factor (sigma-70 family)
MDKSSKINVKKFQEQKISRREFLKEEGGLILKMPGYLGYNDKDIQYEFYALIASKIDRIISKYKIQDNSSFETWFSLVLRRYFFHFIKNVKQKEEIEKFIPDNFDLLTENPGININLNLSCLSENEQKVVRLKYGINSESHNKENTAGIILKKLDNKKRIEEKITKKYVALLQTQKNIKTETHPDKILLLKEKEKRIRENKRKLEKEFESYSIYPTNSFVSEQLGISQGTVASYLNRVKNKMEKEGIDKITSGDAYFV